MEADYCRGRISVSKKPIEKQVKSLLEDNYWLTTLNTRVSYFRTQDDCDGNMKEGISVAFSPDGDAWVETTQRAMGMCRFRMAVGGGQSLRVRNALLILAEAIRLDNEERPQGRKL